MQAGEKMDADFLNNFTLSSIGQLLIHAQNKLSRRLNSLLTGHIKPCHVSSLVAIPSAFPILILLNSLMAPTCVSLSHEC